MLLLVYYSKSTVRENEKAFLSHVRQASFPLHWDDNFAKIINYTGSIHMHVYITRKFYFVVRWLSMCDKRIEI